MPSRSALLHAAAEAGACYFAAVYAAGFVLGAIRVMIIAPRIGETIAVLLEAPVILAISWAVARRMTRWRGVPADLAPRLLMGLVAFVLLMLAELVVSTLVFHRSVIDHVSAYGSSAGAIGLVAQFAFAALPALQAWWDDTSREKSDA
ncbi:MAG TPA: hypothetical protein VMB73_07305 [Acetobacteraceae bacterium]|jgi:hypothetical protein|nr:hypothetical protein [Acetobacteraceae bacterium]